MFFSVPPYRGQLGVGSRQASGSDNNRESSLDDSGVVDDHEEPDQHSEDHQQAHSLVQVRNGINNFQIFDTNSGRVGAIE